MELETTEPHNTLQKFELTGAMDNTLLSKLKQHKAEIITHLSTDTKTCQSCRACTSWRGSYKCFASVLLDGKSGAPGSVLPKPCERWQARD